MGCFSTFSQKKNKKFDYNQKKYIKKLAQLMIIIYLCNRYPEYNLFTLKG